MGSAGDADAPSFLGDGGSASCLLRGRVSGCVGERGMLRTLNLCRTRRGYLDLAAICYNFLIHLKGSASRKSGRGGGGCGVQQDLDVCAETQAEAALMSWWGAQLAMPHETSALQS